MSERIYPVEDFGCQNDSGDDCTAAIQAAIDRCAEDGGGTVLLSAGVYVAGTVRIKDNVELRVSEGALLMGAEDTELYPEIPNTFSDGSNRKQEPERMGYALLYAFRSSNVKVTGGGTIDVGGHRFQGTKRRPFLIRIIECDGVELKNVTFRQSAAWCCHIQKSSNVTLDTLVVRSSGIRNGDGIDIDSSRNVTIAGCDIKTGDDAICIKATSIDPCSDIQISGCTLESGCSAVKFGTESVGDFRNITVSNCSIRNCGVVALKITAVDGGSVDGVTMSNINIKDSTGPVFIANGTRNRRYIDDADLSRRSRIENVTFSDIDITTRRYQRTTGGNDVTDYGQGIVVSGNPDTPIRNVRFTNVNTAFWGGVSDYHGDSGDVPVITDQYPECHQLGILPAYGYVLQYAENVLFENCTESLMNDDSRPLRWERTSPPRGR